MAGESEAHGASKAGRSDLVADVVLAYLEQARWLQAWHNARSESAMSRASWLLGFVAVLVGLVSAQADTAVTDEKPLSSVLFVVGALTALVGALLAVYVGRPRTVSSPGIDDLAKRWGALLESPDEERCLDSLVALPQAFVAKPAQGDGVKTVLRAAEAEASSRVGWLAGAQWCVFVAIALLVLAVVVPV